MWLKVNDKDQIFNGCIDHQIETWRRSGQPEGVTAVKVQGT